MEVTEKEFGGEGEYRGVNCGGAAGLTVAFEGAPPLALDLLSLTKPDGRGARRPTAGPAACAVAKNAAQLRSPSTCQGSERWQPKSPQQGAGPCPDASATMKRGAEVRSSHALAGCAGGLSRCAEHDPIQGKFAELTRDSQRIGPSPAMSDRSPAKFGVGVR
jgi:hypothetical protein